MNSKILIKNVRRPDCRRARIDTVDLLYQPRTGAARGKILKIADNIEDESAETVYAGGKYLIPSFVDLCAHFCEPGYEYRETIETGSYAAFCGGYSDVLLMPDTRPFADAPRVLSRISDIAKKSARCRIHKSAALSVGGEGTHLCDYDRLSEHGALAFTDAEEMKTNIPTLREAMIKCAEKNYLIILSPQKNKSYDDAPINESRTSAALGLKGEPTSAEEISVASYLILAKETGCRIHIRGITSKGSVELIRIAKRTGIRVSASSSPCYFSFTDSDMVFIGAGAKVYPPLRGKSDREAIISGLRDGTIDCIDSGHTPRSPKEKSGGIKNAAYGAIGLQNVFSAAVTYLLKPGHIDIFRLIELLCAAPAKVLGLGRAAYVDESSDSFNIVSVSEEYILTGSYLKSRSLNCPYMGMSLAGTVERTVIL